MLVDDGGDEPLYLVVEIKDCSGEDTKVDENTHDALPVFGANLLTKDGRWAYTKSTDVHSVADRLKQLTAVASMDAFVLDGLHLQVAVNLDVSPFRGEGVRSVDDPGRHLDVDRPSTRTGTDGNPGGTPRKGG